MRLPCIIKICTCLGTIFHMQWQDLNAAPMHSQDRAQPCHCTAADRIQLSEGGRLGCNGKELAPVTVVMMPDAAYSVGVTLDTAGGYVSKHLDVDAPAAVAALVPAVEAAPHLHIM